MQTLYGWGFAKVSFCGSSLSANNATITQPASALPFPTEWKSEEERERRREPFGYLSTSNPHFTFQSVPMTVRLQTGYFSVKLSESFHYIVHQMIWHQVMWKNRLTWQFLRSPNVYSYTYYKLTRHVGILETLKNEKLSRKLEERDLIPWNCLFTYYY